MQGYEICIRGRMDPVLMDELGDLAPETRHALTLLTLETDDQATLHGTMARIRDLGLVVEWVSRRREGELIALPERPPTSD